MRACRVMLFSLERCYSVRIHVQFEMDVGLLRSTVIPKVEKIAHSPDEDDIANLPPLL
jgi:hypothetical protein